MSPAPRPAYFEPFKATNIPAATPASTIRYGSQASALVPGSSSAWDARSARAARPARVVRVVPIPYAGRFTYDLLPSGPTGAYFANGVLLGSTL